MTTEIQNDFDWCPFCNAHIKFLSVTRAAKLADCSQKTIYRHIEEGNIYVVKLAGGNYRICARCLFKPIEIIVKK